MTGYGRGQTDVGDAHVTVELRATNHRYLDLRTRFAGGLSEYAAAIEDEVKPQLVRGRVELFGKLEHAPHGSAELDMDRARAAFQALIRLRDELCPGQEVPLSLLSAVPDLFQPRDPAGPEQLVQAVLHAARLALQQLLAMREAEGAVLRKDLIQRVARIRTVTQALSRQVPAVVAEYRKQLQARIAGLLPDGLSFDPGRLEQEIALFADRADVAEELTRLDSHCQQFAALVDGEADAVGRRLDFLLQEMAREANTIGSKISSVAVTMAVVELKAELERMREQAQNVL